MPERDWYLPIALFLCGVWRRSPFLDSPAPSADPLISAKPTLCSRTEVIIEKLMVFKRVLFATVGRDAAVTRVFFSPFSFLRTVGAHETHRCDFFFILPKRALHPQNAPCGGLSSYSRTVITWQGVLVSGSFCSPAVSEETDHCEAAWQHSRS